jgi:HD-like signal output (HDOD) protein/ActR/RegA family two-component response regulator
MKNIVFVDDEPDLLESLRVRLYKHRREWSMKFLGSGAQAVAELEASHVDVLVSDIRMPGMDGGQLLSIIKERWPATIRIVLSGYSDDSQALRLTALAHQYIAKPCNSEEIEDIINRCLLLQELLGNESLRRVVGRIGQLPAMPKVYARLQTALASPNVTAADISAIVTADAAISTKVLQLTNSAFFRLRKPIVRVKDAITYLGFATVRNLVMSAEVFAQWKLPRALAGDVDPEHLQHHALQAAQACKSLATGKVSPDDAWLAGLVHDLGYWILAQECPEELKRAIALSNTSGVPLFQCERQTIGATHAEMGAYLLGLWGLPNPIVEAVALHHTPTAMPPHGFDLLAALAVSDALLGGSMGELKRSTDGSAVDAPYFASLNAPFDLAEAERRVAASVSPESIH